METLTSNQALARVVLADTPLRGAPTKAERVQDAARLYIARRDRVAHPCGQTGRGGKWYPSDNEHRDCCDHIRAPSYAYPWSLSTHCRSAEHVAELCGVDAKALRTAARALDKATEGGAQ